MSVVCCLLCIGVHIYYHSSSWVGDKLPPSARPRESWAGLGWLGSGMTAGDSCLLACFIVPLSLANGLGGLLEYANLNYMAHFPARVITFGREKHWIERLDCELLSNSKFKTTEIPNCTARFCPSNIFAPPHRKSFTILAFSSLDPTTAKSPTSTGSSSRWT